MTYRLGSGSLAELSGVHDDLVRVVSLAITYTSQDFSIHDGIRTADEQNALYAKGASKLDGYNKISRHQTGHAVDLVPYVNGRLRWEWDLIFPISDAMRKAAVELRVPIRWGGSWSVITEPRYEGMTARQIYEDNPGWDGPHFETGSRDYPLGH